MALLHNRTREKIHAVKDRVSGLEMGQQNLEELMRQQKTMIKQLNESLVALEMTVVETKEALSCAQTWVVLVLLILAGYAFYKAVKTWSRVHEIHLQETQLKQLQQQVETLNLLIVKMVVKKEEESVDLNLCSCEEKPSLKKKRRSKKN